MRWTWLIWTCDSLSQFSPDLVLVCAGFDSAIGDPEVLNINAYNKFWNAAAVLLQILFFYDEFM